MKHVKLLFSLIVMIAFASTCFAVDAQNVARLKTDLLSGKLQIGKSRLKEIRTEYGEPAQITDTELKVVYDYGDLKIEFEKVKYWRDWSYDTFRQAVYTDDVDDLRFDLESKELVGDKVTFQRVRKDYGEPTESFTKEDDGQISVYYYGDIRMEFETAIVVKNWRAANLTSASATTTGELISVSDPKKLPTPTPIPIAESPTTPQTTTPPTNVTNP